MGCFLFLFCLVFCLIYVFGFCFLMVKENWGQNGLMSHPFTQIGFGNQEIIWPNTKRLENVVLQKCMCPLMQVVTWDNCMHTRHTSPLHITIHTLCSFKEYKQYQSQGLQILNRTAPHTHSDISSYSLNVKCCK